MKFVVLWEAVHQQCSARMQKLFHTQAILLKSHSVRTPL